MAWLFLLSGILLLLYLLLMLNFMRGWAILKCSKPAKDFRPKTKISIIIPARNEESHIKDCLTSILNNDYPQSLFEIIVIDDFSEDNTARIAGQLLKGNPGRVLALEDYLLPKESINSFKKKALSVGIGEAEGSLILTTDADCLVPQNWLQQMAFFYETVQPKAIVAPVSFLPAPNKIWLYYFQSLDFMTMQGITAAGTRLKIGSMSNGANFAFEKAAFEAVNGYDGIDNIASGDDMLLLYKIKKKFPDGVCYLKNAEAVVKTPCQPNLSSFFQQRLRWSSKSSKYEDKSLTLILGLVYLFNLSFLVLFVIAFFIPGAWALLLALFVAKVVIELMFLTSVADFYGKMRELIFFPFLQPLHIIYIISVGFLGLFGSYRWKGREVV